MKPHHPSPPHPRYPSRLINRSGMTFLPSVTSRENLQLGSVAQKVTKLSRHQGLHREFDGAIDWCSLLLMLRREFESDGAENFTDSQWLSLIHRGRNKPRFQYCLDSNENLMYIRAIPGHSGGALVDPELLDYVEFCFGWKSICTMSGVH